MNVDLDALLKEVHTRQHLNGLLLDCVDEDLKLLRQVCTLVKQGLYLGLFESEGKGSTFDYLPSLRHLAHARYLLDDTASDGLEIFKALVYYAEARVLQRYIERIMDLQGTVKELPDYEWEEQEEEDEKVEEDAQRSKRKRFISGDGSVEDPRIEEEIDDHEEDKDEE